jgi:S-DNA-T family DNA segregation ATPase FtsK/SpoIIIE
MTWDKGFNFRATSTYVTDGTDETYVLAESYPTTRNGVTFGYTSSTGTINTRDRLTSIGPELAGLHFDGGSGSVFRVDLPAAGDYDVRFGAGDPGNAQTVSATFKDGASTLWSLGPTALAAGHVIDALGVDYTDAAWPGSNTAKRLTWGASALTLTAPASSTIQHLFVSQVSGSSPQTGSPLAAVCTAVALAAAITLGGITATPATATSSAVALAPVVSVGGITVSPAPATASSVARTPAVSVGGVTAAPSAAVAQSVALAPSVANGSGAQSASPAASTSSTVALSPAITVGGLTRTPAPATSASTALSPGVSIGGVTASPASAVSAATARAPAITLGNVTATPASATSASVAVAPTITARPPGAHDAALTGSVAVRPRLAGTVALGPALAGHVTARPRLTGTITIRPAD